MVGNPTEPEVLSAEEAAERLAPKNAHDAVFAFVFGGPEHAAGLLRGALGPAISERLDWASLRREPANFVDARLRWRHSDLLFSVNEAKRRSPLLLYVLIEHQSRPDRWMPLRLLRYMLRVWDERLKANKRLQRLPILLPLVVYSGRGKWRAPRSFRDLLDGIDQLPAETAKHVPSLEPAFVELNAAPDEALEQQLTQYGRLMLWAMAKAGDDRGVVAGLRRFSGALAEMMRQKDGQAALEVFWRYLFATHARLNRGAVERFVVNEVEPLAGGDPMPVTVFDRLVEKGRKEGRVEGLAEGRVEGLAEGRVEGLAEGRVEGLTEGRASMLLDLVNAKFGAPPAATKKRIQAASLVELTRWGRRVLVAQSLEDVFDKPARAPRRPRAAASPRP